LIYGKQNIQNNNDLFTQMILSRFEKNDIKNATLWNLWNESLMSLGPYYGKLFLTILEFMLIELLQIK